MTPEQVLADWRGDAAVLRKHGDEKSADLIERLCADFGSAAEEYLTWLDEGDAKLQSGHGAEWLRARFPDWEREGHARWSARRRQYRQVVIPRRANPDAAREAGRQAGVAA